ncbi:MAG TPA: SRPBCC family protein [Parvularculaceae bacterium]|nr:SRPBCC family protein [Parvularculaceae bacterium]HNS87212.1 SRPBCC family protein [Parvularculaceae bacterium]
MKEYGKVAPVEKTLSLKAPPARAFAHFTENMGAWWPLATHSLSQANAKTVVFEAKKGGRIYEIDVTGREREWGRVKVCEAPHRLVYSWVLENIAEATEVEVTFEDDGKGGTDFTLVHRGWLETKSGAERREMYDGGWMPVLAAYEAALR